MAHIYHVIQYNNKMNEKCALYHFFYYFAIRHVLISLALIRATIHHEDYKVVTK